MVKRLLLAFLSMLSASLLLSGCDQILSQLGSLTNMSELVNPLDSSGNTDSADSAAEENTSSSSNSNSNAEATTKYLYNDFTASEKALFMQYIGSVIPFVPNNEYYVEGYYEEYDYENGLNFYTFGNTQQDFEAYLTKFSSYTFVETYVDDYGDTCYVYKQSNIVVDLSYYYDEEYVIDVYISVDENGGDGNNNGNTYDEIMTNAGKGLPQESDGIYDVDFTKAKYTKNVTEQLYYLDGCPTVGSPAVLVVPLEFSDVTAASKGYSISKIEKAFKGGTGDTDYYSVHDYYYLSSYGKLNLDITVLNDWFKPKYASTYYENATIEYFGEDTAIGDQLIMDELLQSLEGTMDLTKFDSDKNGVIDSIIFINTLDIDSENIFQWAYRYWNIYTDSEDCYYEYDGVSANDYLWAPYQFLYETHDASGAAHYNDTSAMNTYTYIHEFGHILGADDYYDTGYTGDSPMGMYDIMDGMSGDHNAFTKFHYGWLTKSRLIVADSTVTITLDDFSKNGDTVIIANNWDESLGAYQEYYVLMYYTNNGLNAGEYGYFNQNGIVVYHVNASLYAEDVDGETYYNIYNTNTAPSEEEGTVDNLIEYVTKLNGDYVYGVGDSLLSSIKDDQGNKIAYTFTVSALTANSATIQFTKNK